MSFNRRGPDRRPDRPDRSDRDRNDRPPGRRPGGDYSGRERPPYPPRDRGGDRPSYAPRGGGDRPSYPSRGGGDRPFTQRPQFDRNASDEGGMSIRLDPRRLTVLKQVAAEADVRPGELVRQWVEERIDAMRGAGRATMPAAESGLAARLDDLAARVAALEGRGASTTPTAEPPSAAAASPAAPADPAAPAAPAAPADSAEPAREPATSAPPKRRGRPRKSVTAAPKAKRVALHDEIIAVIADRGPMTAADLATAVAERGRYSAPRSGKPLDAAMINGRVSNPTYRPRFTRADGRIGLAKEG